MQNLTSYISEQSLIGECHKKINEDFSPIKLPYTFDIYNEGPKNKDYKITKSNIYKIFFGIDRTEDFVDKYGNKGIKFIDSHSQMIMLPLPASEITYKTIPTKESTDNWTKIPEIVDYTWAGAWYSSKFVEYNYNRYNSDWNRWFKMIKPYMHGKISVTVTDEQAKSKYGYKTLIFTINDDKFNKEREDKLKEMKNPNNLQKWAEEADAKEKAEIKKREEEERERKEAEEKWNKWWNSLSDAERLSWTMGYGRGRYEGD